MIIQKTGVLTYLRYLGIFCVIVMGFFSIVATSEDDVKDALNLTFDENFDLSTGEVSVDKNDEVAPTEDFKNCTDTLSVNGILLDHPDWSDIEQVDIDKITFQGEALQFRYKDAWTDPVNEEFTCTVRFEEISDPLDNPERAKYNVETESINITLQQTTYSDWINVPVTQEIKDALNYFLGYRDATFQVCALCNVDLSVVDDWGVTVEAILPVKIEGSL